MGILGALAVGMTCGVAQAQTVVATVPTGTYPTSLDVDTATNTIYVANSNSNNVTVIDGATNTPSTIAAGPNPAFVVANSATNTIYVLNRGVGDGPEVVTPGNILVINGATNATSTISLPLLATGLAVNPVTNLIYVGITDLNYNNNLMVIDAATTNTVVTIPLPQIPQGLVLNTVTNTIYVDSNSIGNGSDQGEVSVIDGATNTIETSLTMNRGFQPMAVNETTNTLYVGNPDATPNGVNVTVIDGSTNTVTATLPWSGGPESLAVNPVTNTVYVGTTGSTNALVVMDGETNNITATVNAYNTLGQLLVNTATNTIYQASSPTLVLNGANNTATSVTVGTGAQAGALNQGTNYIYVANAGSNTVSVINGAATGPAFSASPSPLAFGNQNQGTTSSPATLTVTNTGTSDLTITTVTPGGANMADFPVVSDTCPGATLAAGQTCTVSVEFAPSTTSSESATLTFTDNAAGSPQMVSLTGVGQTAPVPGAMLNPSPVNFGSTTQPQPVGTSATLPVTLTNTGNAALAIASIQVMPIPSEFTQTNNCGSSLAPAASCTISVTFTPVTAGEATATASLSVTDNAAASPQTIPITGTVQNFSLTTSCTTLTVVPGQTAIFTVDMAPVNGFTQSVSLGCGGEPTLATCTVSPNSMTLDGSSTIQAKVTATTTQATGSLQSPFERLNRMAGLVGLGGITGFAALVVLPGKRRVKPARRLCGLIFWLCLLATVATLPSCGGGGVDPPGTAAGTYPLTVTGTFQPATGPAVTEQVSFNLVVQ